MMFFGLLFLKNWIVKSGFLIVGSKRVFFQQYTNTPCLASISEAKQMGV